MPNYSKPLVFINYRRADARAEAGRLAGDLERAFGDGFVFQDVEDIQSGEKWIDALMDAGNQSKVILAIIGPKWLQTDEVGESRLFNPDDWVRQELESAIQQNKIIVPITVNDGKLPDKSELPESLKPLILNQAYDIRTDKWKQDVEHFIKQLEGLTNTEAITEGKNQKQLKLAKMIGFLIVPIILGFIAYYSTSGMMASNKTSADRAIEASELVTENPDSFDDEVAKKKQKFCPEFNQAVDLKTMLFPFSSTDGGDYSVENFIQRRISKTCTKFGIQVDIAKPNMEKNEYYDLQQAKQTCADCIPDILLTGLAFKDASGNFGVQADFGFCDPIFEGLALDADLMEINVANIPISSLSSNPKIQRSVEHVLQIYLGIYLTKKGDYEKSNRILNQTVNDQSIDKDLKKEAYKVIWQNDYLLNQKAESVKTLQKMYDLDNKNLKAVATQSVILYDETKYLDAITSLDVLVNKTSNQVMKEKYITKRADAKFQSKQYAKAKQDYLKVPLTDRIKNKIVKTDKKIESNNFQITKLKTNSNSLSSEQKLILADLQFQNGNMIQAKEIIQTVDINKINAKVLKENAEFIKAINVKPINKN